VKFIQNINEGAWGSRGRT